jgi:hypothetical protein
VDFAHVVIEVADLDVSVTLWVAALGARKNRYPKRAARSTAVRARVLAPLWAALPRRLSQGHTSGTILIQSLSCGLRGIRWPRGQDSGGGVAAEACSLADLGSGETTTTVGVLVSEHLSDEPLEPEFDPGLPRRRSEHGGMPRRDDDEFALAAERDRVAAGLEDYAPDDVPPAADPPPPGVSEAVDLAERGLLGDTSIDRPDR